MWKRRSLAVAALKRDIAIKEAEQGAAILGLARGIAAMSPETAARMWQVAARLPAVPSMEKSVAWRDNFGVSLTADVQMLASERQAREQMLRPRHPRGPRRGRRIAVAAVEDRIFTAQLHQVVYLIVLIEGMAEMSAPAAAQLWQAIAGLPALPPLKDALAWRDQFGADLIAQSHWLSDARCALLLLRRLHRLRDVHPARWLRREIYFLRDFREIRAVRADHARGFWDC